MVQLTVRSTSHLVANGWFQINVHRTWDVFARARLGEEGVEGIVATSYGLIGWHLSIGLNSMFETVKFPTAVTGLDTGLAHVDGDTFCVIIIVVIIVVVIVVEEGKVR